MREGRREDESRFGSCSRVWEDCRFQKNSFHAAVQSTALRPGAPCLPVSDLGCLFLNMVWQANRTSASRPTRSHTNRVRASFADVLNRKQKGVRTRLLSKHEKEAEEDFREAAGRVS